MVFPLSLFGCCVALLFSTAALAQPLARADAIRQAIAHSPEVEAAHHVYLAERARKRQAVALQDPELQVEYEGMARAFGFDTFSERSIGVSQRLEFPARWWLRGQVASRQMLAAQQTAFETVRLEVAYRILQLYDRVLADEQRLRLTEENVRLSVDFLNRARVRFETGDVPRLDVMRAEVALERVQNQVAIAQNALSVSRTALNIALGRVADAPLELADSLRTEAVDMDLNALRVRALQKRPELRGAEWAVSGAQAAHALARVSILPDVSVGLFRQTVNSPAGKQGFWRAGIAAEVPVWGMFRQRGMIAETSAQKAQAEAERALVARDIEREVFVAFMNFQAIAQRLATMRDRIWPAAEAAYAMARRSYDAGKATYLDVMETQRERVDIRLEYTELLFQYRAALTELGRASGDEPMNGAYGDGGFEQ